MTEATRPREATEEMIEAAKLVAWPHYSHIWQAMWDAYEAPCVLSDEEVEELIEKLESFTKAYPEDVFGPVTDEERKQHGSLISRNSAAMGRHCAKFMGQAATALATMQRRVAELERRDSYELRYHEAEEKIAERDKDAERYRDVLLELILCARKIRHSEETGTVRRKNMERIDAAIKAAAAIAGSKT